jgi:hypothetical protein
MNFQHCRPRDKATRQTLVTLGKVKTDDRPSAMNNPATEQKIVYKNISVPCVGVAKFIAKNPLVCKPCHNVNSESYDFYLVLDEHIESLCESSECHFRER